MDPLDRYDSFVDDAEAFHEACERPLPSVVRVNDIKATPDRVRRAFDETGVDYERVEWHDGLFRLADEVSPGNTWPSVHGWVHGQEEVSAVPPIVLDPRPGERVWDACAAPGGKATQLAALMGDRGTVVANDVNLGRLSALRFNAERLGVTSAVVTNRDARRFPMGPFGFEKFDRVLVDAPCSCEGTVRKRPDVLEDWSLDRVRGLAGLQRDVLERAVGLTEPGGTVVYATCTFAPEENEAVLDAVLSSRACRVVPFESEIQHRPGVTDWRPPDGEAATYDEQVRHAHRYYPHLADVGGFFCAKLRVGA
jgi:NOL1/NOP2/sun family putative RNA methylase